MKRWIAVGVGMLLAAGAAQAQVDVELTGTNGPVSAMTLGEGSHAVIALHGAGGNDKRYFFGDTGAKLAHALAEAGFRVIAVTWPGTAGAGFPEVDAAMAWAKAQGATRISLLGHSRGAELAANYARQQPDGTFNTLVQLSSVDDKPVALAQTKKLFAYNKYDKFARWQPSAFEKSVEPKQKTELGGNGHPVSALVAEKTDLSQSVVGLLQQ